MLFKKEQPSRIVNCIYVVLRFLINLVEYLLETMSHRYCCFNEAVFRMVNCLPKSGRMIIIHPTLDWAISQPELIKKLEQFLDRGGKIKLICGPIILIDHGVNPLLELLSRKKYQQQVYLVMAKRESAIKQWVFSAGFKQLIFTEASTHADKKLNHECLIVDNSLTACLEAHHLFYLLKSDGKNFFHSGCLNNLNKINVGKVKIFLTAAGLADLHGKHQSVVLTTIHGKITPILITKDSEVAGVNSEIE